MDKITVMAYEPPDFMNGQTVDEIHKKMLSQLPEDIDKSQGQFAWDFTRPTALIKAEAMQFQLNEAIKIAFPQWAAGIWLDCHASLRGLQRRRFTNVRSVIIAASEKEAVIPKGVFFALLGKDENGKDEIIFEFEPLNEDVKIDAGKQVSIVAKGTANLEVNQILPEDVKIMFRTIDEDGTKGKAVFIENHPQITKDSSFECIIAAEDDETLRERILEYDAYMGNSFVGNDYDYIRWAKSVPKVGAAMVLSEMDFEGPGTVKVVIVGEDGEQAGRDLINKVDRYINSTSDDRLERRAPIGAKVTVGTIENICVFIRCTGIKLDQYAQEEVVIEKFLKSLKQYYVKAAEEGVIKNSTVSAILSNTEGVSYFYGIEFSIFKKADGCRAIERYLGEKSNFDCPYKKLICEFEEKIEENTETERVYVDNNDKNIYIPKRSCLFPFTSKELVEFEFVTEIS